MSVRVLCLSNSSLLLIAGAPVSAQGTGVTNCIGQVLPAEDTISIKDAENLTLWKDRKTRQADSGQVSWDVRFRNRVEVAVTRDLEPHQVHPASSQEHAPACRTSYSPDRLPCRRPQVQGPSVRVSAQTSAART